MHYFFVNTQKNIDLIKIILYLKMIIVISKNVIEERYSQITYHSIIIYYCYSKISAQKKHVIYQFRANLI